MPSTEHFHVQTAGGIAVIRYVRPPRNLMTSDLMQDFARILDEVRDDASVRAVIFTGGIDGYFVGHADIGHLLDIRERASRREAPPQQPPRPRDPDEPLSPWDAAFMAIESLPQPVLAAINGQAWGGGCEIALACDFRIMSRAATIGLPEVSVGIIPGAGGTQRLPRLIGMGRALELILSARVLGADEAERIGLVHRAVDPDRLLDEAVAFLQPIIAHPAAAVAEAKQAIRRGMATDLRSGLLLEARGFMRALRTGDAGRLMSRRREGLDAPERDATQGGEA